MTSLDLVEPLGEVLMTRKGLPELYKRAHDGDVNLRGALTVKDAGQHRHALLRERVRQDAEAHFKARIGYHSL